MRRNKAVEWLAESLNEYADLEAAGMDVPGHAPASPMFWFLGLARETAGFWKCSAASMLNENAKALLRLYEYEVWEPPATV